MKFHLRLARASFRTLAWSLILVAVGVLALLRTALGHEVILGWALAEANQRLAGRVEVEGLRSANILRGSRLLGVELRTPDGQVFLSTDSLELSYSVWGLIRGDLILRNIRVWGTEMDLVWSRDREGSTLERWLSSPGPVPPRPEGAAEAGPGPTVRLEDIRIEDAVFRLRRPTGLSPDGMVRVLPVDGGSLALDVRMDALEAPALVVAPAAQGGTVVDVASARGRVDILQETIPIRELATRVQIAGQSLNAQVEALELPQFQATGSVEVFLGQEVEERVRVDLDVTDLDGEALRSVAPWAPPVRGAARVQGRVQERGSNWSFGGLRASWAGGAIRGSGSVRVRDGVALQDVDLRFEELPVDAMALYLPIAEGKPGVLSGNARLDGPVDQLGVLGRIGIRTDGNLLSTADVSGTLLRSGGTVAFSNTEIRLSPLSYPSLDPWVPGLPVAGTGSARLLVTGSVAEGLRVDFDVTHRGSVGGVSRMLGQGSFRQSEGTWRVDVQGDAAPFQLAALLDRRPGLPVQGAAFGSFRVAGAMDSLGIRVEVRGEEGRLEMDGTLNPQDLTRTVSIAGVLDGFRLGAFVTPAGDRTVLSGEIRGQAEGRGESMVGVGTIRLVDSRLQGVRVDSIFVDSFVREGRLVLDTARASVGGVEFDGGGDLALPGVRVPSGTMEVRFQADSLMGLRPAFLGEVVHARDTLQPLDREILLLEGVDPDTLPVLADVTLSGSLRGRVALEGALDDFQGSGEMTLEGASYGEYYLERASLEASGTELPGEAARLDLRLDTDSLHAFGRGLAGSQVRTVLGREGARASVRLVRSGSEDYTFAGGVSVSEGVYRVDLDQADLRFDSAVYSLTAPARFTWTDSVFVVDRLELVRPGPEEVRIAATGNLPQRGNADFRARVQGARLERLVGLLQLTGRDWRGRVDLDLQVVGPAASPAIQGNFQGRELVIGQFEADSTWVDLDYRDRVAQIRASAWNEDRVFLEGEGSVPVDLSLRSGVDRTRDDPLDLAIQIREVDVAPLVAILEDLEDVEGVVSGDFTVRGTLDEPTPEGIVRLENGAWTVGALGVRQRNVQGIFTLTPDGSVAVNAQATSGGRLDLSGQVMLTSLTNPDLDLALRFQGFQAVDRRDVTGALTGTLQLTGAYTRPRVAGSLSVDRGVLFLEEFQRAAGVVDLTDPLFLGLVERETFAIPVDRPLLSGIRNPFLDSLRLDVDLTVPRDTWLRSGDMNVEIGGELDLAYDRPQRDLVLVGELLARRGQYTVFGRTFEVQGGTVSFIGIPGINPLLDIQAVAPVRRQDGGTLEIQASVQGTLVDPRVTLSTLEQGYAQSDLISFLVFGRPSTEITGAATGSGTGQLEATAVSGLANLGLGTLASQLGALAAQRTNFIDYLSVSQVGDLGLAGGGGVASSFSSTQVEVGWYLGRGDVFGVLVLRPLSGLGQSAGGTSRAVAGVRLEWQSSDQYHWEAFMEDPFLRRRIFGLPELDTDYSFGFGFYREWGY
jgi:autotransporter translocation and assembly factor TamB